MGSATPSTVGDQVREARQAAGLTREGLAFKAGLTMATVERIERGDADPRRATLVVIALACGLEADHFNGREAA